MKYLELNDNKNRMYQNLWVTRLSWLQPTSRGVHHLPAIQWRPLPLVEGSSPKQYAKYEPPAAGDNALAQ